MISFVYFKKFANAAILGMRDRPACLLFPLFYLYNLIQLIPYSVCFLVVLLFGSGLRCYGNSWSEITPCEHMVLPRDTAEILQLGYITIYDHHMIHVKSSLHYPHYVDVFAVLPAANHTRPNSSTFDLV